MSFFISCFLFLGISQCQLEDYESGLQTLKLIEKNISPEHFNEFYFYKAVAEHQTLRQAEALKSLKLLEDSFEKLPRRYQAMMFLMQMDLQNWKLGDLGEITRQMNEVRSRLNKGDVEKVTQQKQNEIIKNLDRLIKDAEDVAQSASEKEDQENAKKNGKTKENIKVDSPLNENKLMGETGKGEVDNKKLRHIAENWGAMTPAERVRVTQEVNQNLPTKYKPFIDEYFKSLSRLSK